MQAEGKGFFKTPKTQLNRAGLVDWSGAWVLGSSLALVLYKTLDSEQQCVSQEAEISSLEHVHLMLCM